VSIIRTTRACAAGSRSPTSSITSVPPFTRAMTLRRAFQIGEIRGVTVTKGSVRRSEKSCTARAMSDLPVPDSPVISTGRSVFISRAITR
jgi:hypothetical protein